jgi:uncharacterized protein YukE
MTTPPPQYIWREVQFHPPEADRLADKIHEKIRQMTDELTRTNSALNPLRNNWEGHRKEAFVSQVDPHPRKLGEQIEHLRQQERTFRQIRVTRREQVPNPDYDAYQRGRR